MTIDEIRSKTDSELEFDLEKMKKELFDMRFKAATEASANPARIRQVRRSIARVNTVVRERTKKIRGQEPR